HWSTDPSGPHNLVIPINIADNFSNALKTIPMSERVRWRRHKIKSGEAISQIAEKYNTTISAIKASNNLKNNTIKTDRYLVIPVATKPLSAYSKSANQRLKKIQNRVRSGNKIEHIVKNGESFWTISRQYKVTIRQLASWNGMAPKDTLMVGKKLVVWGNDLVNSRASPKKALGNTIRKLQYTVRNGDSLYLIAQRFKIDIDQIVRWNKINKNKFLQPGQKLTVYVDVASQSS
ncbi:MAG: lytic transglycosylase, partial [Gammaproteobacteria bacterium]|nr:lytic transglycosylase [Gammaproteobacteria bacterium]